MDNGFAGWFRFGRLVDNKPQALSSWRITTQSPETAAAIARLFGGVPNQWQTNSADHFEVLTSSQTVRIVIDDLDCITSDMTKWSRKGVIHHCDGHQFLSPHQRKGAPCGCPESLSDRKMRARNYLGPQPNSEISFRISNEPDLGSFRMRSISWKFSECVNSIRSLMSSTRGGAVCDLSLSVVEFGSRAGRKSTYRQPLLLLEGDAAA
ncbi:hypothetical protein ACFWA5_16325 [Streptomyces mirabilis]|uniref:recombination directionality factor n=1 Tax=Streptomyces mirabilis TaxID=68239 RepID=UPI00364A1D9A